MKRFIFTALLCFFIATPVFASWQADFPTTYQDQGIEQAVADALAEGGSPEEIIAEAQKIDGLDTQTVILALYCAAVNGNDIQNAATAAGFSESQINEIYKTSLDECPRFLGIPDTRSDARNIMYRGDPLPGPPQPEPPKPKPPVPPPSSPSTF